MFEDKNVSQAMRVGRILNRLDKIEEKTISNGREILELLTLLYVRHLENYELLSKMDKNFFLRWKNLICEEKDILLNKLNI